MELGMELGMIGLGKMGGFMVERLVRGGHRVVGFDRDTAAVKRVAEKGAGSADSLEKLIGQLKTPRALWLMVPAGAPVDQTIDLLTPHLAAGDTIIDGGNSYYKDSVRRAAALAQKKINFVDCGTSGGVWGLTEGYSMMVGGDADVVKRLSPIFETLAPAPDKGWGRVGPAGSGHFVKMVHNGIEYGIMQAYAEGLDLLRHKKDFGLDLLQTSKIWQFGSVIRSWLLDLTVNALTHNPNLEGIGAYVTDSGEGRWTAIEGIELGIPLPVITGALDMRFRSQDPEPFANKLLAMMRHEFGGHAVKTSAEKQGSHTMKMDTQVFSDIDALSRGAFKELQRILEEAIARRGRFAIALSGGHTPAKLYSLWADAGKSNFKTPWEHVHLFWGDERYVPQDDPLSNYRMTRETLISRVPVPAANVHPVPVNLPTPEKAAEAYEAELRKFFAGEPPAFDLQLLGLGGEGHTASLFPGSPALEDKQHWVAAVEAPAKPPQRLTFTPVVLNSGRNTFFLVAGTDKREILSAIRNEPDSTPSKYPAAMIRPTGPVTWFLDKPAAG